MFLKFNACYIDVVGNCHNSCLSCGLHALLMDNRDVGKAVSPDDVVKIVYGKLLCVW